MRVGYYKQTQFLYANDNYNSCVSEPIKEQLGKLDNENISKNFLLPVEQEGLLFHDIYLPIAVDVNKLYHLSFDVGQLYLPDGKSLASGVYSSSTQNFTVKLRSSSNGTIDTDSYQNLKNFNIKVEEKNGKVHCELLFQPNGNYDQLVFSLTRILLLNGGDIGLEWPKEGALGRRMTIYDVVIKEVKNLIPGLIAPIGQFTLTAPKGTFFSIDKEEIRVGKEGQYIFDIEDWNKFTFFGIVPPSKNLEADAISLNYEQR